MSGGAPTKIAAVRCGWGVLLLAAPGRVLAGVAGIEPTRRRQAIARVLGTRHLLQGAAGLAGSRIARRAWWVDALHAAGMIAVAALAPADRRAATTDATVAAAFAVATCGALRG